MKVAYAIYVTENGRRKLWCKAYYRHNLSDVIELLTGWGFNPEVVEL